MNSRITRIGDPAGATGRTRGYTGMSSVAVRNNLSTFIDAVVASDSQELTRAAREVISRAEDASELIGQIGLIAMRGDSEGHAVLTLGAASMLCRWLIALRYVLGEDTQGQANGG